MKLKCLQAHPWKDDAGEESGPKRRSKQEPELTPSITSRYAIDRHMQSIVMGRPNQLDILLTLSPLQTHQTDIDLT